MKRKTLKFIACAAAMALTLSVTACGGSGSTASTGSSASDTTASDTTGAAEVEEPEVEDAVEEEIEEEIEEAVEEETEAVDEVEEEAGDYDDYETLEDYFNDPDINSMFSTMIEAMSEDELAVSYEVNENNFIMIFQITDSSMIVDGMAEGLAAALDQQAGQFKSQAAQFDEVVEQEGACSVTVRYTDPDDNVLAEQTFTAD